MITARSTKSNTILNAAKQTLPRRLLLSVLPLVVGSLAIAGTVGYMVSSDNGREAEKQRIQQNSNVVGLATKSLVEGKQEVMDIVRQSPEVLALFTEAAEVLQSKGLANIDLRQEENIAALEKQFDGARQLAPDPEINSYLKRLLNTKGLAEIFITDRDGFTLAAGETTSDFIQSDENWWQQANANGSFIDQPEFDESSKTSVLPTAKKIYGAQGLEALGVVKIGISTDFFQEELAKYVQAELTDTETIQVIDSLSGSVLTTLTKTSTTESQQQQPFIGGDLIKQLSQQLVRGNLGGLDSDGVKAFQANLQRLGKFDFVDTIQESQNNAAEDGQKRQKITGIQVLIGGKYYSLSAIPGTDLVAVSSESSATVDAAGNQSLLAFSAITIALSLLGIFVVLLIARNLAQPLVALTRTAEDAADGKLNLRVEEQGTSETRTLAQSFNRLLDQVQSLLKQQEELALEQGRQREELEHDVMQLMEDVGDASDGDLTVRAQLSASDVGIVADLFNSIIENLRDTAMQVKTASGQVSMSLDVNAEGIRSLATQRSPRPTACDKRWNRWKKSPLRFKPFLATLKKLPSSPMKPTPLSKMVVSTWIKR